MTPRRTRGSGAGSAGSGTRSAGHPPVRLFDLVGWIREHSPGVAERWAQGLLASDETWKTSGEIVLRTFCRALVSFLPGMITPGRTEILPLWSECAELFGSVAARRGLSAGEVIEEFQLLREVILIMMFEGSAAGSLRGVPLREILLLNRAIDMGVTQSSVGHTDLLFFSLLHGSGAPEPLGPEDLREVRDQVTQLRDEGRRTMLHLAEAGSR